MRRQSNANITFGILLFLLRSFFWTCSLFVCFPSEHVSDTRSRPEIITDWFQVTMYRKGKAATSARKVFYYEIDFASVTHFQSCKLQAKAYR